MDNKCLCGAGEKIVLACSGASDLGQLTDIVARKLRDDNIRKMNCLAVIGAGIETSIESFKKKNILVIDGCPIQCGKKILDQCKFDHYHHLIVTDLGYKKGKTSINDETVQKITDFASTYV